MHFKFTTAGESHGKALVAIVEGVPAGLDIDIAAIDRELWRRQQGYGRGGRMKIESDKVEVLSGVRHGKALGSPIALMIENKDFENWRDVMAVEREGSTAKQSRAVTRPRPGHADLAGGQKFGVRDLRDVLERASARETAARVACGAIAKQLLAVFRIDVKSHVIKIGHVQAEPLWREWEEIATVPDDAPLRCADETAQREMIKLIDEAKKDGDTLGGIFEVVARGVPAGLGAHTSWEDKLDGRIARAIMSIHAVKAVELGTAVANAAKPGSEVHDEIFVEELRVESRELRDKAEDATSGFSTLHSPLSTRLVRRTNRAGGIEGGITNGEEVRVRGYMKPLSTLRKPLRSVDIETKQPSDAAFERSDITAVPAAGVIGEAMLAVVLANEMREKFGGDSLGEMKRNFDTYHQTLESY
jgi:chorismate synthase